MPEYEFLQFESAGRRQDRPHPARPARHPERPEPGLLVELDDAFRRGRRGRPGPGGHPRRHRAAVLLGPRHGLGQGPSRSGPATRPARSTAPPGPGAEDADAAGVALLLPEHAALAQPAQDHRGPGPGHRVCRRPHAHVGLRPDRGGGERAASPMWSAPGSACAGSSTSGTRGSSVPARPRSSCSPGTPSTSTRPTGWAWCPRSSRPTSSTSRRWPSPGASPSCRP